MSSTERAYAVAVVEELQEAGFTIRAAWDGGDDPITTLDGRLPLTARQAVDVVRAVEHGAVELDHPEHGRVTLSMLFQNGAPDEVIYDYSAKDSETLAMLEGYVFAD